jgi:hypothetical protein
MRNSNPDLIFEPELDLTHGRSNTLQMVWQTMHQAYLSATWRGLLQLKPRYLLPTIISS